MFHTHKTVDEDYKTVDVGPSVNKSGSHPNSFQTVQIGLWKYFLGV